MVFNHKYLTFPTLQLFGRYGKKKVVYFTNFIRLLKYLFFLYHDSTSKGIIMFNKKLTIWHKISSNINFIGITILGDNWHICLDTTTMITLCLASFFNLVIVNNGPLCHGSFKIFVLVFLHLIYNIYICFLLLVTYVIFFKCIINVQLLYGGNYYSYFYS